MSNPELPGNPADLPLKGKPPMRGNSRSMTHAVPAETRETMWRTLQTFGVTRIVIAVVLLAYLSVNTLRGSGGAAAFVNWQTCIGYVFLAVGFALLSVYWQRKFMLHLLAQITLDIVAISLLYVAAGGASSGLAILYLFPLAGSAILAPLILALFFCSIVTLIMLAESGFQMLTLSVDASVSLAGLYGAAFFAAIYLINRLAARLIKQESLVVRRGQELQQQEAINRLVIADMEDGILVVGRDTEVFAGNPALERMLGLAVAPGLVRYKLTDIPSLSPVADAFFVWLGLAAKGSGGTAGGSTFVRVKPGIDIATTQGGNVSLDGRRDRVVHLKLRFAAVESTGMVEDRTVIFLQDVTEIENQAQQLKLASMGRLTASIAHEVRNPLSAISHAGSLLREDISEPTHVRLLKIIGDNVVRLNRMIEDILKLSRKAQSPNEPIRLAAFLAELLADFSESHAVSPGVVDLSATDAHQVRFDPLHLREVVVNLLSNALRYASGRAGSIRMHALSNGGRLELHVQDDGPPISQEVRAHLFEPFYTTSRKGTGLGLYVARELCLNNDAMLDYEYRTDMPGIWSDQPAGRFVITFSVSDSLNYC